MTGATHFSFDPTEFAGKRALVTGGTKGMGEAIVRRLATGGATVATTARSPAPEGQAAALFVQADISTREGVDKAPRSTGPSQRRGHPRQQCWRVLHPERRRAGSRRRGLAAHHRHQPVRRCPSGPRTAAWNAEAAVWRHHPYLVDPAALAAVRGDARLRRRQGRIDDLQ